MGQAKDAAEMEEGNLEIGMGTCRLSTVVIFSSKRSLFFHCSRR
jgi:hypothetical protein